ncbi:MAG: porin, partial [Verrucomicrobiota bacterium]
QKQTEEKETPRGRMNPRFYAWAAGLLISFSSAVAGEQIQQLENSFFSEFPVIYQGGPDSFVQQIVFAGMIQHQVARVNSNQGDADEDEFRRFRFGGKATFGDHFLLFTSVNFDPEGDLFYDDLSMVYLAWSPFGNDRKALDRFQIAAGKLKPRFTHEYSTAAKRIRTFERSLLVNQLAPAKATGMWIAGSKDKWSYVLAGFSGDDVGEYSEFRNGWAGLAKIGYAYTDNAKLGLDWLYASDSQEITAAIDHAFSLSSEWNTKYEAGNFSLVGEIIYSSGRDANLGDAWGLVVMPGYLITDKLELVARYQFAASSSESGLRLQRRYERSAAAPDRQRGDLYHAGWLGLNYYINEHKLKLMSGVEYSYLDGPEAFSGWSWFSGMRLYF